MNYAASKEDVERVVRMYKTTGEAAKALGISMRHLITLCKKFGFPTPPKKPQQ
jgi:hypothetical protein